MPPILIHDLAGIDFSKPGKHHYQLAFHLDGDWGYSLVPLTVINGLRGPAARAVAVFGGTHGDEYEGQVVVKRLCLDLDPADMSGRVILVPQLSETACRGHSRVSAADGVNMNRAFPGAPRGSLSYRIAHFVRSAIFPQVEVVIDIHSGGKEAVFGLCASFHHIPDPAQRAENARVARLFDTPFVFLYASSMASGLLSDEAEALGKVTIGGEFGFGEAVSPTGARHAYEGTRNVLRHYGLLDGPIVKIDPARPEPPRFVEAFDLEDYVPCPRDGVWEPVLPVGSDVRAKDLIGRLHDFDDHSAPPVEVRAHRDGTLIALHFGAAASKGRTLYVIARAARL